MVWQTEELGLLDELTGLLQLTINQAALDKGPDLSNTCPTLEMINLAMNSIDSLPNDYFAGKFTEFSNFFLQNNCK